MSRTVTVTLDNGEPLQFANVPDSVTPDQIAARAQQETGRSVVTIDGGAKAPAAQAAEGVPAEEPAETTGADTGPGEYYDVPPVSAPDTKGLESELEQYYRSLPKGTAPAEAKLNELATKYGQPPVSNYPEILAFYEKYGTLNPTVAMQGQNAVPPPPPEIEDIVGTVEPAGDAANRARALAKGAFFDFGDEMEAIARVLGVNPSKALLGPGAFLSDLSQSAAQKFTAGEITADEYYRTKNQINAEYNAYAKANPGEALALEVAGGVAGTFIPGVGIVGKGVQLGRGAGALARGAVAGGSTGALSGLGQAETMALSDIAPSVIEQAAIGTAFGGTLGKGFDMLGRRIAPGRSAALPEERRAAEILIDATQGGASPQRSAGAVRAAQASGVPMPFGMVSDELAALSERVLAKSGPAGRDLARTVVETQAEAGERVAQQAREALPTGRDFFDEQGAITQRLRQIGEQDYQKAFAVGTVRDPQIENLIRNPELASIWKEAQSLARLGGRELNVKLEAVFDEAGALVGVKPTQDAIPDVEALDYFKRALDDQIDAGFRGKASGGKSRAAALRDNIRKPLINRLDELVPEYREARSKYAGDLEVREALDYGRDLLSKKLRPQEVSAQINKMSIAEREAVKTGALQALLEPLEDATRRGNVAQQIIGAGEGGTSKLAKLRSVMDPAEYDFFETALRLERDLYNRASRATGGSRTTPLAEGVARIDNLIGSGRLEDAVNFVMAGPQGRAAALARWVSRFSPNREFGDKVYGQLSKALKAQNPQELSDVLGMLARSESYARTVGTVGDVAAQRIAPAVGGVAPSLVEDRGINPPPAMSIGNAEAETDEAEAAAQAAVDAPLASEEVAPEADNSEPEVSIIMIDGREAIYDPTAGAHIFTDTNEFVDAAPMKRGGRVKGYQKGGEVRADGPDKAGFEGALADYYASLRGTPPQPAVIEDLAAKYRVGTPTNLDTILDYYRANNGALNPGVRMLPAETSVSASPEADYYPGLARALAEGAFYGFNDEIEGAVRAAPALLTGGFGDAYGDEVSRIREQQALFMEQNPEEYLGAVMGGAMLPAVVPGGQALTAARLASLAARAPGAGRITNLAVRGASPSSRSFVGRELPEIATGSVLYGAGVAPSIEDIPQSVVDELGMGLGVYGAQSAAGAAGRAAGRPVKRTYSKLRNQVRGGR
jgi:hypothetical protein